MAEENKNNLIDNVQLVEPVIPTPPPQTPGIVNVEAPDLKTIDDNRGQIVKTQDVKTGTTMEGPKTFEAPDLSTVTDTATKLADEAKADAEKTTEELLNESEARTSAIKQDIEEKKNKLIEKTREDTERRIVQQRTLRDERDQQNMEKQAREARIIMNSFSHQLAQGKDSGYINALNMSSIRSANNSYNNSKDLLDIQFTQDSINIYNREFDTVFRLEENVLNKATELDVNAMNFSLGIKEKLNTYKQGVTDNLSKRELDNLEFEIKTEWQGQQELNNEWNINMKESIEKLFSAGKFEEAMAMAEQASQVSDHPYFRNMTNPDIVDALRQDNDVNVMNTWNATLKGNPATGQKGINAIAYDAISQGATTREESMKNAFILMGQTPEKALSYVNNMWSNVVTDPALMEKWGVTEEDARVIEEYLSDDGGRDLNDEQFQKAFFNVMMNEAKDEAAKLEFDKMAKDTEIDELLTQNPGVASDGVLDWYEQGMTNDYFNIETEDGIVKVRFYDSEINVNDMESFYLIPGLDVRLREFEGDAGSDNPEPSPLTGDYTASDALIKKTIGGVDYTNSDLSDAYSQYYRDYGSKFGTKSGATAPMNMDEWAFQLRKSNRDGENIKDFKTFNSKFLEDKGTIVTDGTAFVLDPEVSEPLKDADRQMFNDIASGQDINEMKINDVLDLMSEEGMTDEFIRLNEESGGALFADVDDTVRPDQLNRGLYTGSGEFSQDNIAETISGLKIQSDGTRKGVMMYGGQPRMVEVHPSNWQPEGGANYRPVMLVKIINPDEPSGEVFEFKVRIPIGPGGTTDTGSRSNKDARNYMKTLGGK